MGQRGPAPAPASLRLLQGKSDGRDSGGREVVVQPFDREAPACPTWLDAYGKRVWAISVPTLVRLKLTKPEDAAALAAYCDACSQFRIATLDIRKRGLILEVLKQGVRFVVPTDADYDAEADETPGMTQHGYFVPAPYIERKQNPSVAIQNAAAGRIKAFAREFGFTPSAENSLSSLGKDSGMPVGDGNPFAGTG